MTQSTITEVVTPDAQKTINKGNTPIATSDGSRGRSIPGTSRQEEQHKPSQVCTCGKVRSHKVHPRRAKSVHVEPCISEIEPNLFLGNFAAAEGPNILEEHRFTAVVSLKRTNVHALLRENTVFTRLIAEDRHLWIEINDDDKCDMLPFLDRLCDFIDHMIALPPTQWNGKPNIDTGGVRAACGVLIHCQAVVFRSSTAIIAYMMRRHRSDQNRILRYLKEVHPRAKPRMSFQSQLDVWMECGYCVWADEHRKVKKQRYAIFKLNNPAVKTKQSAVHRIETFFEDRVGSTESPRRNISAPSLQDLLQTATDSPIEKGDYDAKPQTPDATQTETGTASEGTTHLITKFRSPCGDFGTGRSWSSIPVAVCKYFRRQENPSERSRQQ